MAPFETMRPCREPGCPGLTSSRRGFCEAHQELSSNWDKQKQPGIHQTKRWRSMRTRVISAAHGLCQMCKAEGIIHAGHEVDHIVPVSKGGDESMLTLLCHEHHVLKTRNEQALTSYQCKQMYGYLALPLEREVVIG